MLLENIEVMDVLAHFSRERIPERVVHAHGGGAFGYFEVTDDITQYTGASVFSAIRKKTNIAVRFSVVMGNKGSSDTVRDVRGFAIKFYTEDGIWDLVGNNTPIFFVRDAARFPYFVHSQKRNPVTDIMHDWDMYWDFLSLSPESVHQVMFLYSDRGIPDGFRYMHGYGSNTFKFVNNNTEAVYCKFHYLTDQGIKNLPPQKARELSGTDPDYSVRDLYNAIARNEYPSWTMYIQVMTFEQAAASKFNPFDVTKVWPSKDYPLKRVGKFVLNRNCTNYFAEIEQLCFSPSNLIPGIEPSPDKMLQGRLFAYKDTQRHRVGPNFAQLPVNRPLKVCNYERDGPMVFDNQGGAPNYCPNSFKGPTTSNTKAKRLTVSVNYPGDVASYNSEDDDNYSQPRDFWRKVLKETEKLSLVENVVSTLKMANETIQLRMINVFTNVDEDFGKRVRDGLHQNRVSASV